MSEDEKKPEPGGEFKQGMTIPPGSAAYLDLRQFIKDENLCALIHEGKVKLTIEQGPRVEDGDGRYHSTLQIFIDDKPYGTARITWESK